MDHRKTFLKGPTVLLSDRFKHAFKVALAMVITYGIAMSMGWEKPFWAGISVIFCSMATAGESIDRGVQRVVGTALAAVAALTLIALFPQERWLFLLAMSAFIAVCTYVWAGWSRNSFIWLNAGFNLPIVALLGEGLAASTFDMAILRTQETGLGVVVYSLVAVLVWPRKGGTEFRKAMIGVCDTEIELYKRYFRRTADHLEEGDTSQLRAELLRELSGLGGRLQGATYDSAEIWEQRRTWRRCLREFSALHEALDQWHTGVRRLKSFDVRQFLPGVAEFANEIETRLSAVRGMLSGQPPARQPRNVEVPTDWDALGGLPHVRRAAVLLCQDQLARIDTLTRSLFDTASVIGGVHSSGRSGRHDTATRTPFVIDLDRLAATARQSVLLWLLILLVIYMPAFPNVVGTIALANAFAMAFAIVPFVQARVLLVPSVAGAAFAGSLYIFLMPHLSGFWELGVMIFAATLLIGYLYYRPQDFLARAMGLTMLVIIIGAENEQTYNILYFANWLICAIFFVAALCVAWRFPVSFRPEVRFLSMQRRYFHSLCWLLSEDRSDADGWTDWLWRRRRAHHLHEITVLPRRLQAWSATLPADMMNKGELKQLESFLHALEEISDRIRALFQAESATRLHPRVTELTGLMREWRISAREVLSELSLGPGTADLTVSRSRLRDTLARIEEQSEGALDSVGERAASVDESERTYRMLGTCRHVSEALMDTIEIVLRIDWTRLREARF